MSRTAAMSVALAIALGSASAALAGPHGGGGGSVGGMGGGHGGSVGAMGGGVGAMSVAHGPVGGPGLGAGPGATGFAGPSTSTGPMTHGPVFNRAGPTANAPAFNGGPTAPIGRNYPGGGNWTSNNWHHGAFDHHHHNHGNAFFAFGFGGGPYYDYAYNSCWAQVPTYYGWQWAYVCGDYYGYY